MISFSILSLFLQRQLCFFNPAFSCLCVVVYVWASYCKCGLCYVGPDHSRVVEFARRPPRIAPRISSRRLIGTTFFVCFFRLEGECVRFAASGNVPSLAPSLSERESAERCARGIGKNKQELLAFVVTLAA